MDEKQLPLLGNKLWFETNLSTAEFPEIASLKSEILRLV